MKYSEIAQLLENSMMILFVVWWTLGMVTTIIIRKHLKKYHPDMATKIAPPLLAKSMSSDIAFVKFLMGSQHKTLSDDRLSMYAKIYKVVFMLFLISFAIVGKIIIKG